MSTLSSPSASLRVHKALRQVCEVDEIVDDGERWIERGYTYWLKLAQNDDVDNVHFRQWPVQALVDLDRDVQQVAHHGRYSR
jgi:hypothetical protein